MRPEPQAGVRSTLPEAMAALSALVGAPLHGALRSTVHGEAGTGEDRNERGAQRRREEDAEVRRTMPSNQAATAASRRASGARSERNASGGARDTRPKGRDREASSTA